MPKSEPKKIPKSLSVIIWEKTIYCQMVGKGWISEPLSRLEDAAALIQEHYKPKGRLAMLYDPDILQTEYTECPGNSRDIAHEALAGSHETIANSHTAWGLQQPWPIPGAGGANGTLCSYETTPSLYPLLTTLRELQYPVNRVFPFTSLAFNAANMPGRTFVFIVVDQRSQAYVYLQTAAGVRAARKLYAGKRENYDVWSEISTVFNEYSLAFDDGGQRPLIRIYQAPGTDVKTQCPYWSVFQEQALTEVSSFDGLANVLNSLPPRHISSLVEDMPRHIDFDFGMKIAAAVLAVVFLGIGIYAWIDLDKDYTEIRRLEATKTNLTQQKNQLERNKKQIETLRALYSRDIFDLSDGRVQLLQLLPSAIPREATLTSVAAGHDGGAGFRLTGVFWNQRTSGAKQQPAARTAAATTPLTPITRTLETQIPGLLCAASGNQIQPTGDFVLQGTTPQPESMVKTAAKTAGTKANPSAPPAKTPAKK